MVDIKLGAFELHTGKAKLLNQQGMPAISGVTSPALRSMLKLKVFFDTGFNTRYDLYDALVNLDPDLQGAINTVAIIVAKGMKGFTLDVGQTINDDEKTIIAELNKLHELLEEYYYDIAYKLYLHGDVPYFVGVAKGWGILYLKWIPMPYCTILDDKDQFQRFDYAICIQDPQWYVLNEIPTVYGMTQWIKAKDVVHFNWGRTEELRDRWNRRSLGIYTMPPLEALSTNIIWKMNLKINDILVRDLMVPREHHTIPGEPFNPELYEGATYEEKVKNATAAAQKATDTYAKNIEDRKPDRAYVTLSTTNISVVEPKMQYTAPNEQITQLNSSINASMGTPGTVISGATSTSGAGSFGSEIAIGNYFMAKSEFIGQMIARKLVGLARRHLTVKFSGKYSEYYDKIGFKQQIIFYPDQISRIVTALRPLKMFTRDELREMAGYPPLTKEQKDEIDGEGELDLTHTQSPSEAATHTASVQREPASTVTPHSKEQRQKT